MRNICSACTLHLKREDIVSTGHRVCESAKPRHDVLTTQRIRIGGERAKFQRGPAF